MSARAPSGPGVGERFGRYEVLALLGRGGMGAVYRARDLQLGRMVALKVLLQLDDPKLRERFAREARSVAALRHPGIVSLLDAGDVDGVPYLALELVEGETLARAIERGLEPREAARLASEIARAVAHAHDAKILHRDLKPANVLLERDGRARVSDFGLARAAGEGAKGLSASGQIVGTPGYMSPEQASSEPATELSDVYGIGAILYEMLTGRPPHEGPTPANVIFSVIQKEPPPPRSVRPRLHADLETVCLKALEKEPGRRYPSAAALADDLGRFLAGEAIVARPTGALGRIARRARRHKLAVVGVALPVILVVTAAVAVPYAAEQRARRLEEAERVRLARRAEMLAPATEERDPEKLLALAKAALEHVPTAEELAVLGSTADARRAFYLERRLTANLRIAEATKARDEARHRSSYARAAEDAATLADLVPAKRARWSFVRALAAYENDDQAGARAQLQAARAFDPESGFGLAADIAVRGMDGALPSDFRAIAVRAAGREPNTPEVAIFCATALAMGDMILEARDVLSNLLRTDLRPRCDLAERRLEALGALLEGRRLVAAGNEADAEKELERAVSADPSFDFAFVDLTRAYRDHGKWEELRDAADRGLAHRAPRSKMLHERGAAKLGLHDPKGAIVDLEEAAGLSSAPATFDLLSVALFRDGQLDRAFAMVQRAIDLDSTSFDAHVHKAGMLFRSGQKAKALEVIDALAQGKVRPLKDGERAQVLVLQRAYREER